VDDVRSATTGATRTRRGFALDLAAVLAPYGRQGRLAVRVERMRDGARLSKGRNNGDNTWSLAPEELEGVLYLPPDDRVHADRLALRIIELNEEGGTTLAVVEFPLAPTDAVAPPEQTVAESADTAELDRLRRELAAATELSAARATELAELRRAAELATKEAAGRTIESELTSALETARAAWDAELQQRLGEAAAALETSRALAQAEHADALAQTAARGRAALEQARAEAKAEREVALQAARAEHEAALAAAEGAWRADAEARLAEAEQRGTQAEQALAAAEARWRAEADARLVEAEQRQAQAEQALAAVTARLERTERALNEVQAEADLEDGEVRRLRDALAALTGSHEAAKGELAHWRQRAELASEESAKKRDPAEIETALTTARAAWEAELTRRLEETAAAADAHLAASRAAWQAEEAERRVAAEARLEERIEERLAAAREEGRQAAAPATGAAPDTPAVAEAQAARELAALAKRLERSEAALAQARTHAQRDEAELARLRQGVADLSARLDEREADLVRAQSALAEAQRGRDAGIDAQRQQLQRVLAPAPTAVPRRSPLRRLVPAGAVAVAAALVAVYLSTGKTLVSEWWPQLVSVAIGDEPAPMTGTSSESSAPTSPAVASRRGVVGATGANLRAGPSTSSAVIAALPRDAEVTLVERHGSWMQVRTASRDGTRQQEGWVYAPSLKEVRTAQP
jgi:SH3 domain-containing protein